VLERDAFPVADIPRKGVPQGKHAHGLLARGRAVIEEFFPGWTDEVVGCGGVRGDIAGDVNWIGHGVTIRSVPSDLVGLLAARPVLECPAPLAGVAECPRHRALCSAGAGGG
jgi:hypothetical protein